MSAEIEGCGEGAVWVCDSRGIVLEMMVDRLGIAHTVTPGRSWIEVVDEESAQKARDFLTELQSQGATFDWELNVPIAGHLSALRFAGIVQGEQLLIIAARTNHGATQLFEEFVRINNEQANALRTALKENAALSRVRVERDSALYDEISRLNNELITLQRELAKKNAELEKLNELKNRFLGMAAHDLRSSLHIIMVYSELVLDEASETLSQEHVKFLTLVRSSSQFMRQLVDDFLDVAIIESGKLHLNLELVDLIALVEQNVTLNNTLAEKKRIRLSFHHDERLPKIGLDAAKIEQVLNNLISNAIKFSYPDSAVEIHVTTCQGRAALPSEPLDDSSAWAVISVRDHGQGIPADELDKLFRMFERTTVRSTGGEKSSGLGLAIARRIVEGHHGKIGVESQVGQGTTFYVSLPLQPASGNREEIEYG